MKILFLAANPSSTSRLKLDKEAREIEEGLKRSKLADKFQFVQRWSVRPEDLRRSLLEENPDIVHFSGHGRGSQGLVLVDNSGQPKPATGEALADLFAYFPTIKCVLLNACYAEKQAKTIVQHIDYVIGMKDTILDEAAIAFTKGFYDGLGYGRNFKDAFGLGRNSILLELASFSQQKTRQMIPVNVSATENPQALPENLKPILLIKSEYLKQQLSSTGETETKHQCQNTETNPLDLFRDKVKEKIAARNLTPVARYELENFAQELGISESDAKAIIDAEKAVLDKAKETYRNLLQKTIEEGFNPLVLKIQQDFKSLQQKLELTDSEVATITEKVLARTEAKQTESDWKESTTERIINIFQGNYNESIQGDYIQGNRGESNEPETNLEETQNTKLDTESKIQKFSFEVITVNERGKENSLTTKEAEFYREDLGNRVILDMVKIPDGEFLMGSPEGEGYDGEKPQHKVSVQSFWLGKYPVTQAQWQEIMGSNPSYFKDNSQNPVERVSWNDAQEFCQKLTQKTGHKYRLPSEAEWEYACRAGTKTPFHFGETISTDLVNYNGNYKYGDGIEGEHRKKTTSVGYFKVANNFGLYDMHGNVWEWCMDDGHHYYNNAPNDGKAHYLVEKIITPNMGRGYRERCIHDRIL